MKKVLKVLFLVAFAGLSVNAGRDVASYRASRKVAQVVIDKVKESPYVKSVAVKECVHLDDTWLCDTTAVTNDGTNAEAILPVPDEKIR